MASHCSPDLEYLSMKCRAILLSSGHFGVKPMVVYLPPHGNAVIVVSFVVFFPGFCLFFSSSLFPLCWQSRCGQADWGAIAAPTVPHPTVRLFSMPDSPAIVVHIRCLAFFLSFSALLRDFRGLNNITVKINPIAPTLLSVQDPPGDDHFL